MSQDVLWRLSVSEIDYFRHNPKALKQIVRDGIKDKERLPGEVMFAINWLDKKKFLEWVVLNAVNPVAKSEARKRIKQL